jgi:hypothetical protein
MSVTKQYEQIPPEEIERLKTGPIPPETAPMAADRKKADSVDGLSPVERTVARRHRMRLNRG